MAKKKAEKKPASVNGVLKAARKKHGDKLFSTDDAPPIPTRFLRLDRALGGGLPSGKLLEVFGEPGSYKSTLVYCWMADVQEATGRYAVLLDEERAWSVTSPAYLARLGVDLDKRRFIVIRPDHFEQSVDLANELVDTGQIGILGVDSVAALATAKEADTEVAGANVAAKARKMSQWLDKALPKLANAGTVCACVNQIRQKIGVVFGNPETTPGGSKLKFLSSVRLRMSSKRGASQAAREAGERLVRVAVVKNKITGGRDVLGYRATPSHGFLLGEEPLEWAVEAGLVRAVDGGYAMPGAEKSVRRKDAVVAARDNLDMLRALGEEGKADGGD